MESQARDSLGEIVRQYGPDVVEDPRRCEAFLRDLCPGLRREVNVLVSAMRDGVPAKLRVSAVPAASALDELAADLARDLALATDAARWAVESWAVALGVVRAIEPERAGRRPTKVMPARQEQALVASRPDGARPARWPRYLSAYEPPAAMTWTSFRVSPTDGMPQVLIPAAEFLMGSPMNQKGRASDEGPRKRVYVSAFWMDLHEVTVGHYRRFCQATGWNMPSPSKRHRHPVVMVSWDDATAYAAWAGRELPTEAQWEKAARGGTTKAYPWGERWDAKRANGRDCGPVTTTAVGSSPPNGFGLLDMIGNVWEWCRDWYDEGWYGRMSARDPVNTTQAMHRVCRGGSCLNDPVHLRVANRDWAPPGVRGDDLGFRCVEAP